MKLYCNAKINLSLDVKDIKKPEGYHTLDMINLPIDLSDVLDVTIKDDGNNIVLHSNNGKVPTDSRNVIYKIIEKFKKEFNKKFSIEVNITKNIPTEAGLGGGSSDAAFILNYLDEYFKTNMSLDQKIDFIMSITSDGPFFLTNKVARIKNKGEIVIPIDSSFDAKILLIKPFTGCSTKEIYGSLDYNNLDLPDTEKVINGLKYNDLEVLYESCKNSLQKAAMSKNAEINDILTKLKEIGFGVVSLSGSGSTCFAISKDDNLFKKAQETLNPNNYELFKIVKINQ